MNALDRIIDAVLAKEGAAYTNNPSDKGGPTKYGITQAALAAYRGVLVTPDDVARLTEAEARAVYYRNYITAPGFDKVAEVDPDVGAEVVDAGVLSGQGRAALWLQVALNALNRQAKDYADIREDGAVGPSTLVALRAYLDKRGADGKTVLLRALNAQQGAYFIAIARGRVENEDFVFGWLLNRVGSL